MQRPRSFLQLCSFSPLWLYNFGGSRDGLFLTSNSTCSRSVRVCSVAVPTLHSLSDLLLAGRVHTWLASTSPMAWWIHATESCSSDTGYEPRRPDNEEPYDGFASGSNHSPLRNTSRLRSSQASSQSLEHDFGSSRPRKP